MKLELCEVGTLVMYKSENRNVCLCGRNLKTVTMDDLSIEPLK